MMLASLAALPILLVLVLMLSGRSGRRAGPAGWLAALVLAYAAFGADAELLFWSQVEGLMLSLWVLYIVWAALLLYRVVEAADGFRAVATALSRLTADPSLQRLVLAWVFASFLQGVTGFGVPVAVVAPLLVGLGVPAVQAVVASSFGHAWAVTFGSVGSSMYAMLAVTGLDAEVVAPTSAALLGAMGMLSGFFVLLGTGRASLLRCLPTIVVVGAIMSGTQWALTATASWPLAAFAAGAAGLLACALCSRLPWHRAYERARTTRGPRVPEPGVLPGADTPRAPWAAGWASAFLPYVLLTLLMAAFRILWPGALDFVILRLQVPETTSRLGWINSAGTTQELSVFGHTGALIAYSALLAHGLYRFLGRADGEGIASLVRASLGDARKPALSIAFLVGMSQALGDAGMTDRLASALAGGAGAGFALGAPAIGAIGAFVTGSNTNSNVLFAALQAETAERLGLSVPVVLAGQNLGAALGSVLSPAKLVVAVSTVGVLGAESDVLRRLVPPALATLVLFGAITWWLA